MQALKNLYNNFKIYFQQSKPGLFKILDKRKTPIKYIFAGGTATAVDLALLYLLTDGLKIYYLFSAVLAFIAAFFVSFFLQKFWTFRDNRRQGMRRQMSLYFLIGSLNLGLNSLGIYILVDYFNIMYLLAQIIMGALIPVISYLCNKFIIFKKSAAEPVIENREI